MAVQHREYTVDDLAMMDDPMTEVIADETITFAVNGKGYKIDLTHKNAAGFFSAIRPYTEAGRMLRPPRSPRPPGSRAAASQIRQWCRDRNIAVNDHGRIPDRIIRLYDEEQPQRA